MWRSNLSLRVAGPTILVSCLLLLLCVLAAVYFTFAYRMFFRTP